MDLEKGAGFNSLIPAETFPALAHDGWKALAKEALGGRDVESIGTTTPDGIKLHPVYGPDSHSGAQGVLQSRTDFPMSENDTSTRMTPGGWDVRALVADAGTQAANATALGELECGATSLLLDLTSIGLSQAGQLAGVLDRVHLDMVGVWLAPGPLSTECARWLLDLWRDQGVAPSDRNGGFGLDPLGVAARHGGPFEVYDDLAVLSAAVADAARVSAVTVDATPYAEAGATPAWELACSLATGVAYLRSLTAAGLSLNQALATLTFTYSADTDQFTTIAKLRAARCLWHRVAEACGASPSMRGQAQHVVTSAAMLTRSDPWVNMLRNTVAVFSAGVGGAQAITVRPFDYALGTPDEFGRRTARNTQLLLIEEAGIGRVADPAGGSWYVEDFTKSLTEAAWGRFQDIEARGGMIDMLTNGHIEREVSASWAEREARLMAGEESIIGVTVHSDPDESPLERPRGVPAAAGPMPLRRRAEMFEGARVGDVSEQEGPH